MLAKKKLTIIFLTLASLLTVSLLFLAVKFYQTKKTAEEQEPEVYQVSTFCNLFQAYDGYTHPDGSIIQTVIRGNTVYARRILAGVEREIAFEPLNPNAKIYSQTGLGDFIAYDVLLLNNVITQTVFRNNLMGETKIYQRQFPAGDNASNYDFRPYPGSSGPGNLYNVGSGIFRAYNSFVHPNGQIVEVLIRGGTVYTRSRTLSEDPRQKPFTILDSDSKIYTQTGSGAFQAFAAYVHPNGNIIQTVIRGNTIYSRSFTPPNNPDFQALATSSLIYTQTGCAAQTICRLSFAVSAVSPSPSVSPGVSPSMSASPSPSFSPSPSISPSPSASLGVSPSPSASPLPSASRGASPSPSQSPATLICQDLTGTPQADLAGGLVVGKYDINLTCSHRSAGATFDHYNYRIVETNSRTSSPSPIAQWTNENSSVTWPKAQQLVGTFTAQCQACTMNNYCTNWGQADGWYRRPIL